MKKAFIITSCIEVDESKPLTYSKTRSIFDKVERFRQTAVTLASLDTASDNETFIFLVDLSDEWQQYKDVFSYQKNLIFVSVKQEFPEIFEECRSNPNKSAAESLLMSTFLSRYKKVLSHFHYFVKISGRYFLDSSFNMNLFTEENKNKLFFKHPLKFDFNDSWGYDLVDRRKIQKDNKLYQYPAPLYAWGIDRYDSMLDIFRVLSVFLNSESGKKFDLETMLYYFTREYEQDIIEVDWLIYGFIGVDGTFMRY